MSRFTTFRAFSSMNLRLGSTMSPINIVKVSSAATPSSILSLVMFAKANATRTSGNNEVLTLKGVLASLTHKITKPPNCKSSQVSCISTEFGPPARVEGRSRTAANAT